MINICICDDEDLFCREVDGYCRALSAQLGLESQAKLCHNGEELNAALPGADLLFLDIEIGRENGIDLARSIREQHPTLIIVFMTNHIQYAVEGYTVQAYRYLLKPVSYAQFAGEMSPVFRRIEEEAASRLVLHDNERTLSVSPSEILWLETLPGKKVCFHLRNDTITVNSTLSPYEHALGKDFYRVHSSFLLNLNCVRAVEKTEVLLDCGVRIPLSRHRRADFYEAFLKNVQREKVL